MYIPKDFELKDQGLVLKFLEQHPFGSLAVNGPDGFPAVVHIPFTCEFNGAENCLEFHVAKANSIVEAVSEADRGKMIVLGAHGYISSSVYTHVNVPTYNYESVHASGKLEQLSDAAMKNHLSKLVDSFESDREKKVRFDQWPADLIEAYMQEIVGYRLKIQQLEAGFKLSQNRNEVDFNRILDDLDSRASGDRELAQAMKHAKCPVK